MHGLALTYSQNEEARRKLVGGADKVCVWCGVLRWSTLIVDVNVDVDVRSESNDSILSQCIVSIV